MADRLPDFLVYEIMDRIKRYNSISLKDYYTRHIRRMLYYDNLYNKYKLFFDLESFVLNYFILKPDPNKPFLILYGTYLNDIILGIKGGHNKVIVNDGKQGRLFSIKHKIQYISINSLYPIFAKFIFTGEQKHLLKLESKVIKIIRRVSPKALILWDDVNPIERLFLYVCKKLKIPTINVQHGFYSSNENLVNGLDTDYIFVWGEHFKRLYLDKNIGTDKSIKVLGYPYRTLNMKTTQVKNICFLDANFEVLLPKSIITVPISFSSWFNVDSPDA